MYKKKQRVLGHTREIVADARNMYLIDEAVDRIQMRDYSIFKVNGNPSPQIIEDDNTNVKFNHVFRMVWKNEPYHVTTDQYIMAELNGHFAVAKSIQTAHDMVVRLARTKIENTK